MMRFVSIALMVLLCPGSHLDALLARQVVDLNRLLLPETVDAADALLQHHRVPGQLEVDDRGG